MPLAKCNFKVAHSGLLTEASIACLTKFFIKFDCRSVDRDIKVES